MGVMLSLDRPVLARSRRQARHARRPDDQAWADAVAAIFRDEPPRPSGCLARLAKTVLAGWLLPAQAGAAGPAEAGAGREHRDDGLADRASGRRAAPRGRGLSGACLLGQCEDSPGAPACASAGCEHDCHRRAAVPSVTGVPAA